MSVKLHPRALCKSFTVEDVEQWPFGYARLAVAVCEDNTNPERTTRIFCHLPTERMGGPNAPDEQIALAAIDYYLHELGEHFEFASGLTLNTHTPEGRRTQARLIQLYANLVERRARDHGDVP